MKQVALHSGVGNDFVMPMAKPAAALATVPVQFITSEELVPVTWTDTSTRRLALTQFMDLLHTYSLGVYALLILLIGVGAIKIAATQWTVHHVVKTPVKAAALHLPAQPAHGPNVIVQTSQLATSLQAITGQPINLAVGEKSATISSATIRNWLQVVSDKKHGVTYIHVNQTGISKALSDAAAPYMKDPLNQVTVTYADGTSKVVYAGRNGTKLGDTSVAAKQIADNLLGAKGFQLTLPVETLPFAAVTPAAFDKMIEVDVSAKQMWLYEKGQLVHQYAISAGAPATPTPLGQYKIFSKYAVQDMKGFNADGTKYLQPHVHWINYFLPGGYAIHGNYWRPLSWFGAINSSHGCASLPDDQAEVVYNWAPIGTTVITHA